MQERSADLVLIGQIESDIPTLPVCLIQYRWFAVAGANGLAR